MPPHVGSSCPTKLMDNFTRIVEKSARTSTCDFVMPTGEGSCYVGEDYYLCMRLVILYINPSQQMACPGSIFTISINQLDTKSRPLPKLICLYGLVYILIFFSVLYLYGPKWMDALGFNWKDFIFVCLRSIPPQFDIT